VGTNPKTTSLRRKRRKRRNLKLHSIFSLYDDEDEDDDEDVGISVVVHLLRKKEKEGKYIFRNSGRDAKNHTRCGIDIKSSMPLIYSTVSITKWYACMYACRCVSFSTITTLPSL
jgi:hypothetical protein